MEYKAYIGIDPGKEGAIVVMFCNEFDKVIRVEKEVMPLDSLGRIDVTILKKRLDDITNLKGLTHCVLEHVHAIPKTGAKQMFNFGYNFAVIVTLLTTCNIPFTQIGPKTWQKEMWTGIGKRSTDTSKQVSLAVCKRLFPKEDLRKSTRSTTPHDGIVDALLIAEYCRRRFK